MRCARSLAKYYHEPICVYLSVKCVSLFPFVCLFYLFFDLKLRYANNNLWATQNYLVNITRRPRASSLVARGVQKPLGKQKKNCFSLHPSSGTAFYFVSFSRDDSRRRVTRGTLYELKKNGNIVARLILGRLSVRVRDSRGRKKQLLVFAGPGIADSHALSLSRFEYDEWREEEENNVYFFFNIKN